MMNLTGFQIEDLIYRGNSANLYRGLRNHDQRPVIIKQLNKSHPSKEELARFRQEYTIMHSIHSSDIVKAYSLEKNQNSLAMILEDFNGQSIEKLLPGWKFELGNFLKLAIQITKIITRIHQEKIIHKNINPGNIIWNQETAQVKITDFGAASRLLPEAPNVKDTTDSKIIEGELAYISPEQAGRMNRNVNFHSDFYSLGVTLYEISTRQLPFASDDPVELIHSHIARTPVNPSQLNPQLPAIVSEIILKLMAKIPEDRYQGTFGLKSDLEECLISFNKNGEITKFQIAQSDIPSRFLIPQKNYGRDREVQSLNDSLDRVCKGSKETILISGQSGVGKSTLANTIKKSTIEGQPYIIYGKFDQLSQNVPFAALRQAFSELGRQIAVSGQDNVLFWQKEITNSVGKNGQAIIDVIPEIEFIIGKQPEIPELPLPPADAQNRFNRTFLDFIHTFANNKQPLAIIIDDLQWADEASLKSIELIINDSAVNHLLFIGIHRNDALNPNHPLPLFANNLQTSETPFTDILLQNLETPHINQLLSETLSCPPEKSQPLAVLCFEKTYGNPFFLKQFLQSLHEDNKIYFNDNSGFWQWDIEDIRQAEITDNVIELMSERIHKLPETTQFTLQAAACIGTRFDLLTMSQVIDRSMEETAGALESAMSDGIVLPTNDSTKFIKIIDQELGNTDFTEIPEHLIPSYSFCHDRIQQAAYSLIPDTEALTIHRKIGRHYLAQTREKELPERIFKIVNQLNLAVDMITKPEERSELAALNLTAGQRAKNTSAFKLSLNYLNVGISLMTEKSWAEDYDLTLTLYSEAAEAAMLCVDLPYMGKLTNSVLKHARSLKDKIKIHDLMIQSHYSRNDLLKVIEEGLGILNILGHRFPENPNTAHIIIKLARTKLALAGKPVMELNKLPDMTNENSLATMRIGFNMAHAAYGARPNLNALLGLHGVIQSVKYGIAPESPAGFAGYGMALCGMLNDIDTGLKFGKLAMVLNNRNCASKYRARTILIVSAFIDHWQKHLSQTLPSLKNADAIGREAGDFEYATLSVYFYCAHLFFTGAPLESLSREIADYSKTIREYKQDTHFYFNEMARQTVLNFIEETDDPCRLAGDAYDEENMLPMHHQNNDTSAIHMLFFYKLMLGYHFENYPEAYKSAGILKQHLDGMASSAYIPLYHFYDALLRLATYTDMSAKEQKRNLKIIAGHQKKLKKWAARAPMNFLHKWTLVEAERLRILGEDFQAVKHYDEAVALAAKEEYIQEEALANELSAKFWLAQKKRKFAELYMQKAVACYTLWNAKAKVDFLHKNYPQLTMSATRIPAQPPAFVKPALSSHSAEAIDLNSVIKASQAISGEIVLDQLLKKLITVVLENAGAQKALLLSEYNNQWIIEAEGKVLTDGISALTEFATAVPSNTPLSIIRYAAQIKKYIVLNNAAQDAAFQKDPYILEHQPRSVLCTPIFHQGRMANILYLENNLITGAFTPDRLELIQFLSSQAAISLQNASLYFRLQASEKKYRSIFENAIEGIFQLSTDGRFLSINQSMAEMLGYESPKQLMASDENMKYHFFSDLNAREQFAQEFKKKGQVTAYEIEGTRKDNTKIWGSLSIRAVYDSDNQILHYEGSVMDITHQKNKEKAEKEAEAAKAAAKAKGDFLTNMSHEIRTPMNAIVGMTELALETELSSKQQGYLKNIKMASTSLIHLIDDILHFSKIESGKIEIERIEFKLSDIIDKIHQMFSSELAKNKMELICSISNDIPQMLIGDPLKISQILINLISNAIKFMDTGEINLHAEPVSRNEESVQLRFCVKDTGIGIAKENIGKLFDSFTQADGSITRKYGGTGLGLAISKSLVELMDGRIWAESIESQGSTFYFEIQCQYRTDSSETKKPLPTDLKGMKVLLVEDNPINRQIAVEILENRALTVDVAENGEQAIESVKKGTYDAVLMDIHMPVMDGLTATRIIREEIRNKDLPIIAMTAHTINHNKEKCLQAGMDAFIPKPFKPSQLIAVLSKYFLPDGKPAVTDDKKNINDVVQDILSSGFPETLPGINIKSGLLRMEGRRDLYIRVISEFYNNYRDTAEKIENGIESRNAGFVQRNAHTLKSLAGNIGAETLQQTARIIETKASDDLVSMDKQVIEQLKNNLDQVFLSIRKILDEHC